MRRAALALTAVCLLAAGTAGAGPVPLWQLDGSNNTIFLLGSVHLLRPSDYPLPKIIEAAYDEAELLLMELDTDDLDPAQTSALVSRLGTLESGTLADVLGATRHATAQELADAAGLPLQQLQGLKPWLVAITVEQLMLTRLGFDAAQGVESHFTRRAARDGKRIDGLETLEQQLDILDGLPQDVQVTLLMETLENSRTFAADMAELISAWRRGDVAALEKEVLPEIASQPLLFDALVRRRNENWAARLEELLDQPDDYLVIVGTLHLVGDEGLPAMLERRGHPVRQLQDNGPGVN